jgi:hypothetical protein
MEKLHSIAEGFCIFVTIICSAGAMWCLYKALKILRDIDKD